MWVRIGEGTFQTVPIINELHSGAQQRTAGRKGFFIMSEQANNQQNTELSVDAVKTFLEQNAEAREALKPNFINYETVDAYLNSADGAKVLQPRLDRHFTKGLETWKANNLQTIIDQKINELHPAETPAEKKMREMQERLNKMEQERNRSAAKAAAVQELTEKGLPASVADFVVADSMEATRDRINAFELEWTQAIKGKVAERLKGIGGTPASTNTGGDSTELTKEKLMAMPYKQRAEVYKSNPELFRKIMG